MTTRIYQGRIISAKYEETGKNYGAMSAMEALIHTFKLLQDATNYHMVALAGMAEDGDATFGMQFKKQIRKIWTEHPRGNSDAKTLQQSLTETLHMRRDASLDEVVEAIFEGCERPDMLPYVQQFIMDCMQKGAAIIQTAGRTLLPKLCNATFKGNFDYSSKEKKATFRKLMLIKELSRENITQDELVLLANEMDLSWAGIKTQPNEDSTGALYYTHDETTEQVKVCMGKLCDKLKEKSDKVWNKYADEQGVDLLTEVTNTIESQPTINSAHLLAKPSPGTSLELRCAAIFFMYYPCRLSADLLKVKLGKEKVQKKQEGVFYDCASLEEDPILLARGRRGYVYRGFTALPEWQQEGAEMYSSEWDILAFKEALKTLHSYELKMQERNVIADGIEAELNYMRDGKGKTPSSAADDGTVPILGGDPRYELLAELVKEISPDEESAYTISKRALNAYEEIREKWLQAEEKGVTDEDTLVGIVRKVQGSGTRFGSCVLFEALCKEKYRPIWHDWTDGGKKPRSKNMLRDFGRVQELEAEREQYKRPITITAAEPVYSPRQLLFSDILNFGPKRKGHEYVKGQKGVVKLGVAVRNDTGYIEGATVVVKYSAPRFERDQLGTDAANWTASKKGADSTLPWLQPMMRALGVDEKLLRLEKEPALALQVKKINRDVVCLLNFPVTLNLEALQASIGKAALWKNQMLGGKNQMLGGQDEKLHLHWPATYSDKLKEKPWWENKSIQNNGFDVLGVDLGLRYAAAWSLTHVQKEDKLYTKRGSELQGRYVGSSGDLSWYGYSIKQGLCKIDGEGSQKKHWKSRVSENTPQLPAGVTAPSEDDKVLAKAILSKVGMAMPEHADSDVLILGNAALRALKRLISRLRRYQSILVKLKDAEKQEAAMQEAKAFFEYNEATRQFIPQILRKIEENDVVAVRDLLLGALLELRASLPGVASDLVNLILPRKKGIWKWVEASKPGCICSGKIELLPHETPKRFIYHRGGLSVRRLTQLENLRQVLQSLNRVLWLEPGVTAPFGNELKGIPVEDPCPELLEKIENVREERVNKIAHEIVAQALGVRLVASRKNKNVGGRDVIHGEYEVIPGRKPVDFVVLENLSRYLTSVDRSYDENTTLMRWAHRQLVAKVKQLLEEVFGIPVLYTHAAYTSKFDALTSAPGFRAQELNEAYVKRLLQSSEPEDKRIGEIYSKILENLPKREQNEGLKLLAPDSRNGGEFFVSPTAQGVRVTNADINAAINIAWRGIAAPESLHLLHRLRVENKKGTLKPCEGNKREKALKGVYELNVHRDLPNVEQSIAAFCLMPGVTDGLSFASYQSESNTSYEIAYGRDLWHYMKRNRWNMCHMFNYRILEKLTLMASQLKELIKPLETLLDDDDIPM